MGGVKRELMLFYFACLLVLQNTHTYKIFILENIDLNKWFFIDY